MQWNCQHESLASSRCNPFSASFRLGLTVYSWQILSVRSHRKCSTSINERGNKLFWRERERHRDRDRDSARVVAVENSVQKRSEPNEPGNYGQTTTYMNVERLRSERRGPTPQQRCRSVARIPQSVSQRSTRNLYTRMQSAPLNVNHRDSVIAAIRQSPKWHVPATAIHVAPNLRRRSAASSAARILGVEPETASARLSSDAAPAGTARHFRPVAPQGQLLDGAVLRSVTPL
jgi:hypothetical protein